MRLICWFEYQDHFWFSLRVPDTEGMATRLWGGSTQPTCCKWEKYFVSIPGEQLPWGPLLIADLSVTSLWHRVVT